MEGMSSGGGLEIGISCITVPHLVTRGQKHTHTHTPTWIASNLDEVCPTSFCNAGDVMLTSSSQNKEVHDNYSTPTTTDPPEGKTTAVIAVMRGKPKDGFHRHRSNKHYKQKLVWVLLDSGSDGNLIFVNKDKPMLPPYSKRLVPQSWNTLNGDLPDKA